MYSMDPVYELQLARQRQHELDRQLELRRLLHQSTEARASLGERALTTLADTLVDLGLRLRERYAVQAIPSAR